MLKIIAEIDLLLEVAHVRVISTLAQLTVRQLPLLAIAHFARFELVVDPLTQAGEVHVPYTARTRTHTYKGCRTFKTHATDRSIRVRGTAAPIEELFATAHIETL